MLVYGINVKQSIGASVNLSLHNFASNSKILLEAMPIEDRAKYLKDLDLRHDELLVQSLNYYYGMFQNRQSTHRRNEQLKQDSFFPLELTFSRRKRVLGVKDRPHKTAFTDAIKHPVFVPKKNPKV